MCSSFVHDCHSDPPALNAISFPPGTGPQGTGEEAERKARHLRLLQELAELGMALARSAARRALEEWEEPEAPTSRSPEPDIAATDASTSDPAPSDRPAPGMVERQGAETPGRGQSHSDHALAFARLSRTVRQTIALEARIAAGEIGYGARRRPSHDRSASPGLRLSQGSLHDATDAELDRAASIALLRGITERLEDDPDIEPDQLPPVAETLTRICADLGIDLDLRDVPDEWPEPRRLTPPAPGPPPPGPSLPVACLREAEASLRRRQAGHANTPGGTAAPPPPPHGPDPP